jgi:hypothetical protein
MKLFSLSSLLAAVVAAVFAGLPATAGACSICMGDVNSRTAPATNDAIFLMLGCIGLMLTCLGAFAFHLFKRSRAPLPPHVEVAQAMTSAEAPN